MVVLRWLLVLPAAVIAFIVANLLLILWNMLSPSFATMSPRGVQFMASIIGAYMFVVVGTLVAPAKKNIVAITLTVLLAMLCASITTLALVKGPGSDPLWLLVVCLIASIVAAIVACAITPAIKYMNTMLHKRSWDVENIFSHDLVSLKGIA